MKRYFLARRGLPVSLALGVGIAVLGLRYGGTPPAPRALAAETATDINALGMAANVAWWGALVKGTPAALDAVLAPEFQIIRADGSGHDKAGYLASILPQVAAIPAFSQLVASEHGDVLVTRYFVTVEENRDGKTVDAHAPRLTVFRRDGERWLVVAHGNFAGLEP